MERSVKTVTEHRQALVDFFGGYLCVLLGGGDNTFAGTTIIAIFAPT